MAQHEIDMIVAVINSLRQELSERMDRRDEASIRLEAKIDNLSINGCAKGLKHDDVEVRVRALELDRAKMLGIVSAVSAVISLAGWIISTFLK